MPIHFFCQPESLFPLTITASTRKLSNSPLTHSTSHHAVSTGVPSGESLPFKRSQSLSSDSFTIPFQLFTIFFRHAAQSLSSRQRSIALKYTSGLHISTVCTKNSSGTMTPATTSHSLNRPFSVPHRPRPALLPHAAAVLPAFSAPAPIRCPLPPPTL